jgi:hypothetical protein
MHRVRTDRRDRRAERVSARSYPEVPEWLAIGSPVVEIHGYRPDQTLMKTTVERHTRTTVVLANGSRYRKDSGKADGTYVWNRHDGSGWNIRNHSLTPPDSDLANAARVVARDRYLLNDVFSAYDLFRNKRTHEAANALSDAAAAFAQKASR